MEAANANNITNVNFYFVFYHCCLVYINIFIQQLVWQFCAVYSLSACQLYVPCRRFKPETKVIRLTPIASCQRSLLSCFSTRKIIRLILQLCYLYPIYEFSTSKNRCKSVTNNLHTFRDTIQPLKADSYFRIRMSKQYKCPYCGKQCKTQRGVTQHINQSPACWTL